MSGGSDGGNWGGPPDHVRSRARWRVRIGLTVASVVAGVVLLALALRFGDGSLDPIAGQVLFIVVLLCLGVGFGLRPWSRR